MKPTLVFVGIARSATLMTLIASAALSDVFADQALAWPEATQTMRPWAYNWWPGSAVDEAGLRLQVEEMAKAKFGGMHVIPIYSVKDNPHDKALLSAEWLNAFKTAARLAGEKGLGIDLTMGSGWCFGGPQLTKEEGCWKLEVNSKCSDGAKVLWRGKNDDGNEVVLSAGLTGQKVKRSGPGGHGVMMNPFSAAAMAKFLAPFSDAFDQAGAVYPKRMYHDSYEYYGASWAWELPDAFARRRGYRLEDHYAELAGVGDKEVVERVKCDYRETLSDMLIEEVFQQWANWCGDRNVMTRNEAHGSPVNWLDFYALADIPETEMFLCDKAASKSPTVSAAFINSGDRSILISKFASSAAHVKHSAESDVPLVSSESCTWMCEHFCETAGAVKTFIDRLFLSGVNHVFYQGMVYSPADAKWPGWCFYAAIQMNRFNPLWREADVINSYISRVQGIAQTTRSDNDVLVYWPLHDYWMSATGFERQMTVHKREWFDNEGIGRTAHALYDAGYAFDFISDRQLLRLEPSKVTRYKSIVIPKTRVIKPETVTRLFQLAQKGYRIYFVDALPQTVPGWKDAKSREAQLRQILSALPQGVCVSALNELPAALAARREPFDAESGILYTRRTKGDETYYFLANQLRDEGVRGEFRPSAGGNSAILMNPFTGRIAPIPVKAGAVKISLAIGESVILVMSPKPETRKFPRNATSAVAKKMCDGKWTRTAIVGGPEKPGVKEGRLPLMWGRGDNFPENAFAGTMRYETKVFCDGCACGTAEISLGEVAESARVFVNGTEVGSAFFAPWSVQFNASLLKAGENVLTVEVTSSGANRIKWLDEAKPYQWKIFTDINVVDVNYKKFDASKWELKSYGLKGSVELKYPKASIDQLTNDNEMPTLDHHHQKQQNKKWGQK